MHRSTLGAKTDHRGMDTGGPQTRQDPRAFRPAGIAPGIRNDDEQALPRRRTRQCLLNGPQGDDEIGRPAIPGTLIDRLFETTDVPHQPVEATARVRLLDTGRAVRHPGQGQVVGRAEQVRQDLDCLDREPRAVVDCLTHRGRGVQDHRHMALGAA